MKQKSKLIFTGLFCVVIAILLMCGCNRKLSEYNGNRELSAAEFLLDFNEMNSTCTHTMTLTKDDQLHCTWNISKGTVDLLIVSEEGEKLYQGNKVDHADFKLVVPADGDYTFTVTGSEAKGTVHIQKVEEQKNRKRSE